MQKHIPPPVLILPPFQHAADVPLPGERPGGFVLAAQTDPAEDARFTNVATFAVGSAHVLARIMKDRRENSYRLYILSDDPELSRHVLVGVGGAPKDSPLVETDATGMALLKLEEHRDWSTSYVVVITPAVSFRLVEQLHPGSCLSHDHVVVTASGENSNLTLSIQEAGPEKIGHALAILDDGRTFLRNVINNAFSLPVYAAMRMTELRLFV